MLSRARASVSRRDDTVEVTFLDDDAREKTGQSAELRNTGKDWTVLKLLAWVAD